MTPFWREGPTVCLLEDLCCDGTPVASVYYKMRVSLIVL